MKTVSTMSIDIFSGLVCRLNLRNYLSALPLWLILIFLFPYNSFSQNISKYYHSINEGSSTLYFIQPQEGFSGNNSEFIYDLTYLAKQDSVTMNFSVIGIKATEVDSMVISADSLSIPVYVSRLFIEPKKSEWHARYSSRILFSRLDSLFSKNTPPQIVLYTKEGRIEFQIPSGKWKKLSDINHRIFEMIKYNQK